MNTLHLAAFGGHLDIVKYLIPKFADRRFDVDRNGDTCLHWAAQEGHLSVVKYLVEECGFKTGVQKKVVMLCVACIFRVNQEQSSK